MGETYTQVAPDSSGDKIRNIQNTIRTTDGSTNDVSQQVITRAADDGTILDTIAFVETERDKYMRRLAEDTLVALNRLNDLLSVITTGRTSPYGVY